VPPTDLLHALPIVVLLGVIPGLALATLMAPSLRWSERAALAPGLSVASIGVTGLALRIAHLPFDPATALPVLLVLCAAAVGRWRWGGQSGPEAGIGWAAAGVALAAGAVLVGVTTAAMASYPVPPATDPAVHATVAAAIARTHDVLPIIPVPADGSGFVRPQPAFEATVALASELGAGGVAQVMLPLATLSLLALPLSVALLAEHAFSDRRVAALASLLCLGIIFPAWPTGFGDYPYLVDSTLVVPLILAVSRCLRGVSVASSAAMVGALVLSMWVIHGLEIPTALVIGCTLWLTILVSRRRAALPGLLATLGCSLAGAGVGYLLTRAPVLPLAHPSGPTMTEAAAYLDQQSAAGLRALNPVLTLDLNPITDVLACLGIAHMVLRRRGRWLLGSMLIVLLCILDISGPQALHAVWVRIYPWTDIERVYGLGFFVVPALAAAGASALSDLLVSATSGRAGRSGIAAIWKDAALTLIALGGLIIGAQRTSSMLSAEVAESLQVSGQDLAVMRTLAASLPPGSLVLNDGMGDSGQWITALTPDVAVEPKPYAQAHPLDWRVVALAGACSDPGYATAALRGVSAVFVGSASVGPPDQRWRASCIAALPGLRRVAGTPAGASAFLVSTDPG
jgi:hypothetical protein